MTQTANTHLPTTDDLCRSVLENNRNSISIQKPELAVRKLALILNAALELSNKKGFQAMSLRDLSQTSGVSMGGLYSYFDSKATLLKMILSEVTLAVENALAHPPEEVCRDPRAHLMWLIEIHIRLTEAMLSWFTFSFMEAKNFPSAERKRAIDSEELTESYFAQVLERGVKDGSFSIDMPPLMAALIKPLLQDWYVKRAKYRRRKVDIDSYIEMVQSIVLAACGAKAVGADSKDASDAA
ncbi:MULTISPECIES: TetR family transcriptional regulator [Sulfitobacter]|jgi:AcrR family transcriptional regulator|uniref:TetR/AcrR family transcriptional regulator n=1 Tax=Sulfitobacter TaxID=60136 RepID=UPI0030EB6DB0|tara:strand:- start:707 stop:1426 length:720 start_codon:yes stop_codon:yes gene_type:complete